MSHVTDIILSVGIDERYTDGVNKYLKKNHAGCFLSRVDKNAGGNKAMQCDLFIAAINHLDIDEFLGMYYGIEWQYPENVQLMLKDEHDELFSTYLPIF